MPKLATRTQRYALPALEVVAGETLSLPADLDTMGEVISLTWRPPEASLTSFWATHVRVSPSPRLTTDPLWCFAKVVCGVWSSFASDSEVPTLSRQLWFAICCFVFSRPSPRRYSGAQKDWEGTLSAPCTVRSARATRTLLSFRRWSVTLQTTFHSSRWLDVNSWLWNELRPTSGRCKAQRTFSALVGGGSQKLSTVGSRDSCQISYFGSSDFGWLPLYRARTECTSVRTPSRTIALTL